MTTKKHRFYVVWEGTKCGIYSDWTECKKQVEGFAGAKYMGFDSESNANKAFKQGWQKFYATKNHPTEDRIQENALTVDAACSGNPGLMEYRCVHLATGKQIFHSGPFEDGTNNIGEFLAIVHALALQIKNNTCLPVYSDSANALLWIRKKKCNTKLKHTRKNTILFDLIERAETWLRNNDYSHIPLHKWETKRWGEIPADFGRK